MTRPIPVSGPELFWVWACPLCRTPVIVAGGRWYWGCGCHKRRLTQSKQSCILRLSKS